MGATMSDDDLALRQEVFRRCHEAIEVLHTCLLAGSDKSWITAELHEKLCSANVHWHPNEVKRHADALRITVSVRTTSGKD